MEPYKLGTAKKFQPDLSFPLIVGIFLIIILLSLGKHLLA